MVRAARRPSLPRRVWRREFPKLWGHPGETEAYRRRFQTAVALLLGYRALGTITAFLAFSSRADSLSDRTEVIGIMVLGYGLAALVACWATANVSVPIFWPSWLGSRGLREDLRVRFGRNLGAWLNRRASLEVDVAAAVVLNLVLAKLLLPGMAYEQQADAMGIALITTTILWTGRRGGKRGLVVVGVALLTEVAKAPVNGIPWSDIEWFVIVSRIGWVLCGWIVGLGVTRILVDYAERAERLRIEEEHLFELGKSHDTYKAALTRIADMLAPGAAAGSEEEAVLDVRRLAVEATHSSAGRHAPDTIRAVADEAAQQGRGVNPAMIFEVVDATHGALTVTSPQLLLTAVGNLACNAARYSRSERTVIRCLRDPGTGGVIITVVDTGVGMPMNGKAGVGLTREAIRQLGGDVYREPVSVGTKWVIKIDAPAVKELGT